MTTTAMHPYARIRAAKQGWAAAGLTPAQVGVLVAVLLRQPADDQPTTITLDVLADDLARSRGAVAELVARLTRAGWITAAPVGGRGYRRWRQVVLPTDPAAAAATFPILAPRNLARAPAQVPAQVPAQDARAHPRKVARATRALETEGQRDNDARAPDPVDNPDPTPQGIAAARAALNGHPVAGEGAKNAAREALGLATPLDWFSP